MISGAGPDVCMVVYTNYAVDARVRREAETLAAHGFRVQCLTNLNGGRARRFELDGVTVQELPIPKYRGKSRGAYIASYTRFLGAAAAECVRQQRRGTLDVVHAHNMPDFLVFAGLLPRWRGARVVLDVHDTMPETFSSKFSHDAVRWRLLCLEERLSARVAHRVICVNHPQRDVLVARGLPEAKTFVSMNVPDPRVFRTSEAARPMLDGGPLNLVYHGTMAVRLGVDLLIHAVHALVGRVPGLKLHLWGGGDDLELFRSLVDRLGLSGHVSFRPQGYALEALPVHLSAMDVGLVGNRRSIAGGLMLPVKMLEYVSLGIPVVVPRLRTIAHYFADDMVAYYEPDNAASLAEAIYRLHVEPELRRALPARARSFLHEHGWERQGPALVAFYRQLLET